MPDPTHDRGLTWTPTTPEDDPADRHERIDFVFIGGRGATVKSLQIVGESAEHADIAIDPYASDNRAVVAGIELTQ